MAAEKALSGPTPARPSPQAPASGRPLDPALEAEIRAFVAAQRAPGTRTKYEEYVRDFLADAGIASLGELLRVESVQVVDYRNRLQTKGLSNAM